MPKLAIRALVASFILAVPRSMAGSEASSDRPPGDAGGAGPVRKFSLGTPTFVTRAGFTKVTVEDAFTPERGYIVFPVDFTE